MKKLYEIESEYFDAYGRAIDWAEMGCTLKEMIEEIGFNNITLLNPFEEDTDTEDIDNIYFGSDNYKKMNDKMLNTKVKLSSTYEDSDGFTCATIELINNNDWKLFKKLLEVKK